MDPDFPNNEWLVARVQQLESERNELHKDIEQLCMQQAGPAYLGVATRMYFQRTAGLEQEIESLKNKLATCTRENQNLQEELSEAYLIKSQLPNLHSAEVLKNVEAEKQLKFFQGCVAAAFAERDNAVLEAEKAKEKVELMPQELNKSQIRVEELTNELLEEKGLTTSLRIELVKLESQNEVFKEIEKLYREELLISFTTSDNVAWRIPLMQIGKRNVSVCCMIQTRFGGSKMMRTLRLPITLQNSLEAEIENLRRGFDNLQNKLRVGLAIETHLKKKVRDLKKKENLTAKNIKEQMSALQHNHSQYRIDITNLLDEGYSELESIINTVVEKMRQVELCRESDSETYPTQDEDLNENKCKDVHISAYSDPPSTTKSNNDPGLATMRASETSDTSEALALALHEKVEALMLLSQQDERHLLDRNVNAALRKKIEELQRNLLQVTNEKVKALMELAQLKQEQYILHEKNSIQEKIQGKQSSEIRERKNLQEKDGRLRNLLKKSYLPRWAGGSDGSDTDVYEQPKNNMDFARIKIENATLKESLESMEHLIYAVRRLRILLFKVKDSSTASGENTYGFDTLDRITAEANLIKTALSSSLPVSWSAEIDPSYEIKGSAGCEKMDFVSAAGLEMVELLIFAAHVLKDRTTSNNPEAGPACEKKRTPYHFEQKIREKLN